MRVNHKQTHYRRRAYTKPCKLPTALVQPLASRSYSQASRNGHDTLAIGDLAENCVRIGLEYTKKASVTPASGFVPKPHDTFPSGSAKQTEEELRRKVDLSGTGCEKQTRVPQMAPPKPSTAEGITSAEDRRAGSVIEHVWRGGGTFQE